MERQNQIVEKLCKLKEAAPTGYALGLHIRYTTPTYMLETYARDWIAYYAERGMLLSDPTVLWGFENDGWKDWSELKKLDQAGVLDAAATFGINYGITCATGHDDLRTMGSFSRADRPFTTDEADSILALVVALNDLTKDLSPLSTKALQALRENNVHVSQNNQQDPLDSADVPA